MKEQGNFSRTGLAGNRGGRVLAAFVFLILIGGSNAVAIRFSNLELPPFWGAGIRFMGAAAIFWLIVLVRHIAMPRGRALAGAVVIGVLNIGLSYALIYWALVSVQASLTMVVLSLGPLLTMLFAVLHRLERFTLRGLGGAAAALTGIVIAAGQDLGGAVPVGALLALFLGAACIAEGSVLYKIFPKVHPLAMNAIGTLTGSFILVALSVLAGEPRSLPVNGTTWAAYMYLVLFGSVLLFYLYLYVLTRWTASATSYSFLLFPVATVIVASILTGETISTGFVVGGMVVMVGVWLGALTRPAAEGAAPVPARPGRG